MYIYKQGVPLPCASTIQLPSASASITSSRGIDCAWDSNLECIGLIDQLRFWDATLLHAQGSSACDGRSEIVSIWSQVLKVRMTSKISLKMLQQKFR